MFVFAASGMRRKQSTACVSIFANVGWEKFEKLTLVFGQNLMSSGLTLSEWVSLNALTRLHFCALVQALPRVQGFVLLPWHHNMLYCPVPLYLASFRWQEWHLFFPPSFPPSGSLLLTMERAYWDWKFWGWGSVKLLRTVWYWVILLTEFCPITAIWICSVKANYSIVGRSQRFSSLVPTCRHWRPLTGIWLKRLKIVSLIRCIQNEGRKM